MYVDKGIINSSLQVRTILIYRIYNNPNFIIWYGSWGMAELAPFFPGNKNNHVYTIEAIKQTKVVNFVSVDILFF